MNSTNCYFYGKHQQIKILLLQTDKQGKEVVHPVHKFYRTWSNRTKQEQWMQKDADKAKRGCSHNLRSWQGIIKAGKVTKKAGGHGKQHWRDLGFKRGSGSTKGKGNRKTANKWDWVEWLLIPVDFTGNWEHLVPGLPNSLIPNSWTSHPEWFTWDTSTCVLTAE